MTRKEAAIVSAYTGILIGKFTDMHEYIESILGYPVFTNQLGNLSFLELVKQKAKADFLAIEVEGDGE
jgi:hypothetical protein